MLDEKYVQVYVTNAVVPHTGLAIRKTSGLNYVGDWMVATVLKS